MVTIGHPLSRSSEAGGALLGYEGEGGAFNSEVDGSFKEKGLGALLFVEGAASQKESLVFPRGFPMKVDRDAEAVDFAGGRCGILLRGF